MLRGTSSALLRGMRSALQPSSCALHSRSGTAANFWLYGASSPRRTVSILYPPLAAAKSPIRKPDLLRRAILPVRSGGSKLWARPLSVSSNSEATTATVVTDASSSEEHASSGTDACSSSGDTEEVEGELAGNDPDGTPSSALIEAYKTGDIGFGFSAGGLLFPYYVGIIYALKDMNILRERTRMAGASAGSLIVACYNSGLDPATVKQSLLEFAGNCRAQGTPRRLGPLLREFLHSYLPDDAHERCNGVAYVAMTRVFPIWKAELVSKFESREDLINALLTSCHIPWYFDGRWMTRFRGKWYMDGGAMNFIPRPPTKHAIKVCCFPTKVLAAAKSRTEGFQTMQSISELLDVAISPDKFEEWPYDYQTMLKWGLLPANDEVLMFLMEKGERDARTWARLTGLDKVAAEAGPLRNVDSSDRGVSMQSAEVDEESAAATRTAGKDMLKAGLGLTVTGGKGTKRAREES